MSRKSLYQCDACAKQIEVPGFPPEKPKRWIPWYEIESKIRSDHQTIERVAADAEACSIECVEKLLAPTQAKSLARLRPMPDQRASVVLEMHVTLGFLVL